MDVIASYEETMDIDIDENGNIGEKLRDKSRASRGSINRSIRNKEEYKYELENDWKTSWIGIVLICGICCAAFHNLYSLSVLSINAMNTFNLLIFDHRHQLYYHTILLISRFLLGLAVGFIVTSIDNLLFEWFAIVDEEYFISKASNLVIYQQG